MSRFSSSTVTGDHPITLNIPIICCQFRAEHDLQKQGSFSNLNLIFLVLNYSMPRIRLDIEYDGTKYHGWQVQAKDQSVQGEIQRAIKLILKNSCRIIGAGRTDSGVHARGQVAHTDCLTMPDLPRLQRSLNGILRTDIRIKALEIVPDGFHARYSAKWRIYRYQIACVPQALSRNFCWEVYSPLDIEAMNTAAGMITGEHDFKSFCRAQAQVAHHRCTVSDAQWYESDELLIFEIKANRFLHGMVRSLVGTMVDIGWGKLSHDKFRRILAAKDRSVASQTAPAKGLILEKIEY